MVLLVSLTVGACARFAREVPSTPRDNPVQESLPGQAATPTPVDVVISNRIVYVGTDLEIYTVNPDGSDPRQLTQQEGLYTWPTWSPGGGKVAFSSFSPDPGPGNALFSVDAEGGGLSLLFQNAPGAGPAIGPTSPHYSVWSPDGRYLAFLAIGESGLSLYLVSGSGIGEAQFIIAGAPLYLAWSRDSDSLLVHQGNDLFRVDIDATDRLLNLEARSSGYFAPSWSPAGDVTAFLVNERGGETLYVAQGDGARRRAMARLDGFASFIWARQGDRLAVGQSFGSSRPFLQDIQVVDVATAEAETLVRRPVMSFFWSPDGSKIGYVTTNADQSAFQWRVVDVSTGQDTEIADFYPSADQLTWLAYFDQYASSHQVWSPDGRRLVFAGALAAATQEGGQADLTSKIFVVDVEGNSPPKAIATGQMASWSAR